ncbi:hypothetical protein M0R45_009487 [Rubus argutus]|uniref:Uncharacterized protein n=1 Tax=Rubus argutus TaxID=59490 RepID=A0AAW1Y4S0_RUBAR
MAGQVRPETTVMSRERICGGGRSSGFDREHGLEMVNGCAAIGCPIVWWTVVEQGAVEFGEVMIMVMSWELRCRDGDGFGCEFWEERDRCGGDGRRNRKERRR